MGLQIKSPEGIKKPTFWSSASCEPQRHVCMLPMWPFTPCSINFFYHDTWANGTKESLPPYTTFSFRIFQAQVRREKNHTILESYNFSYEHHNYKL